MRKILSFILVLILCIRFCQAQSLSVQFPSVLEYNAPRASFEFPFISFVLNKSNLPGMHTLTGFAVKVGGNFSPSDIRPNGLKLWINRDNSDFSSAELIGYADVTVTSSIVGFSLSPSATFTGISGDTDSDYLFISVDYSQMASTSNYFSITSLGGVTFAFSGSTPNIVINGSIGELTQFIRVSSSGFNYYEEPHGVYGKIGAGNHNINIFTNNIYHYNYKTVFKHWIVTFVGNFNSSDVEKVKVKVTYENSGIREVKVLSSASGINAGDVVTFVGINDRSNLLSPYMYNRFSIDLDLSTTSQGKTIQVIPGELSYFDYTPPLSSGTTKVHTIVGSNTIVNSDNFSSTMLGVGVPNQLLQSAQLVLNGISQELDQVKVRLTGTFDQNDINTYILKVGNYSASGSIYNSVVKTVSGYKLGSSLDVTFDNLNYALSGNSNSYYLHILGDLRPSATPGRTVQAQILYNDILFGSGTVSGGNLTTPGNNFTITAPEIEIKPLVINSNVLGKSINKTVYAFEAVSKNVDAYLSYVVFTTLGTFTNTDVYRIGMYYTNSSNYENFSELISVGDFMYYLTSGQRLTLSGLNLKMDMGLVYRFAIVVQTSANTTEGKTLEVGISSKNDISISGTSSITGFLNSSLKHTFYTPNVQFSRIPISPQLIGKGTKQNIFQIIKMDVQSAQVFFAYFNMTTGGTYLSSDIKSLGFKVHISPNLMDLNSNIFTTSLNSLSSGQGESFFVGVYKQFNPGTYYIHFTVDLSDDAVPGRTLNLKNISGNNFIFYNVTASGTLPVGSTMTFDTPTISITSVNLDHDFIDIEKYYFNVGAKPIAAYKVTTGNYKVTLKRLVITITGSVNNTNISTYSLLTSSLNPFQVSNNVALTNAIVNSYNVVDFSTADEIEANSTKYYYILPYYINTNAVGLNVGVLGDKSASIFSFNAGTVTGLISNSKLFEIKRNLSLFTETIPSGNFGLQTSNNVIFKAKLRNTSGNSYTLKQLICSITGSAVAGADYENFKLYFNSTGTSDSYSSTHVINGVFSSVTGVVTFGGPSFNLFTLSSETDRYILVTVDILNTATIGRTIQLLAPDPNQMTTSLPTSKSGTFTDGEIKSIQSSSVFTRSISLPALSLAPCNACTASYPIYALELDVSGSSTSLNKFVITLLGMYTDTDVNHFELLYSNTPDLLPVKSLGTVNAKSTLIQIQSLTYNPQLTLPVGKSYLWLALGRVLPGFESGKTIQALGPTSSDYTFSNTTLAGLNMQPGTVYTLTGPIVSVQTITTTSTLISKGSLFSNIYTAKIEVLSDFAFLENINFTLTGTFVNGTDINYLYYGISTNPGITKTADYSIYLSDNSPNRAKQINISNILRKGTYYLHVCASTLQTASNFANIQVLINRSFPSSFVFTLTTVTGDFSDGQLFTFANSSIVLSSVTLTNSGISFPSTSNHTFYALKYEVLGAPVHLRSFYLNMEGDFVGARDFKGGVIRIWNCNEPIWNSSAILLTEYFLTDQKSFYLYPEVLLNNSGYLVFTVDISESAKMGVKFSLKSVQYFDYRTYLLSNTHNFFGGKKYVISKLEQSILNFGPFADVYYEGTPITITLNPVSSSNLPVTLTLTTNPASGVASLSGNTVQITSHGSISLTARQIGNFMYQPVENTQTFQVLLPNSLNSKSINTDLMLYPNPTGNGRVYVKTDKDVYRIVMFDAIGRLILDRFSTTYFDVFNLYRGIYTVHIYTYDKKYIEKLVLD